MRDKKTKVECRLAIIGTDKANANVEDDLKIPDPEHADVKRMIEESSRQEKDDG